LGEHAGTPRQAKAGNVTQIVAGIRQQSQRVRSKPKQHLSEHVDNVQRYTDRKGLSERGWQVMRVP
jgi:hypothetical protein